MSKRRQTRRQWLATCVGSTAAMAGLAGCTGGSDDPDTTSSADDPGVVDDDSDYGSWPMIHYNAANRLSVPHDGLDGEPEILWTAELEGTVSPPVVYDDVAYVSHGNGFYTALDLTESGATIWERETGERGTPAVSDAAVFVAGDGVEARDHDDGDVLWNTGHDESVESLRIYDGLLYAGLKDRVVVLDETGEERLEIDVTETVQSLAVDGDHIYVRSRTDSEAGATREVNFDMAAYERTTGDHRWTHELNKREWWYDDRFTNTFPLVEGNIFTRDEYSIITIEGDSGNKERVTEFAEAKPKIRPTINGDVVYNRENEPTAYDLSKHEPLSEWVPEENFDDPVVIAQEKAYSSRRTGITSPQKIISMDSNSGTINWEKAAPELEDAHIPVVLNGLLLYPIDDPGLVAFG